MPNTAIAAKFRTWADGLQTSIDHLGRPMTQNPTPKRNKEYQSRLHDCRNAERLQRALRALADRHEAGTVPAGLAILKTRDDIRTLVRKGLDGSKGGYYSVIECDDYDAKTPAARELQAMIDAGSALRERDRKIGALEAEIALSKIPGFFPTPADVVRLVLDRARLADGLKVLEPSAGSGNIAGAVVRESHCSVDCIETHSRLRELLTLKGHELIGSDFLETDCAAKYDRVLMNPPFEKQADIDHVRRAFNCLKPGGRLVAIMSPSFEFRSDHKSTEFRAWLDNLNATWEPLPEGAFKAAGTGVNTRLVVIDRPAATRTIIPPPAPPQPIPAPPPAFLSSHPVQLSLFGGAL